MTEIERVVAGLTTKQRAFIPTVTHEGWWRTGEDDGPGIVGWLVTKGILYRANGCGGNIYKLTPLGLEIRAHLLRSLK